MAQEYRAVFFAALALVGATTTFQAGPLAREAVPEERGSVAPAASPPGQSDTEFMRRKARDASNFYGLPIHISPNRRTVHGVPTRSLTFYNSCDEAVHLSVVAKDSPPRDHIWLVPSGESAVFARQAVASPGEKSGDNFFWYAESKSFTFGPDGGGVEKTGAEPGGDPAQPKVIKEGNITFSCP